jgi:hypothetical protein
MACEHTFEAVVPSVTLEHFGAPSSARDMRVREYARREAIDGLAGRTVWCSSAVPDCTAAADALRLCLSDAEVTAGRLDIGAGEPLLGLGSSSTRCSAGA